MGLPALQILTQLSILVAGRLWLLTQPYLFTLLPLSKIVAHFKICCYFNLQQNSYEQWIEYLNIEIKIESYCRHKSWNNFGSLEVFLFALFLTSVFVFGICWPWALIKLCHLLWRGVLHAYIALFLIFLLAQTMICHWWSKANVSDFQSDHATGPQSKRHVWGNVSACVLYSFFTRSSFSGRVFWFWLKAPKLSRPGVY